MIKKIESRDNEFIRHFKEMLETHFPSVFNYKVVYIIGEDEKGRRGLYFELISKLFGSIYSRFEEIKSYETVYDHEEEFINNVINDFVLGGITLMNIESNEKRRNEKVIREIQKSGFKNIIPKMRLYHN